MDLNTIYVFRYFSLIVNEATIHCFFENNFKIFILNKFKILVKIFGSAPKQEKRFKTL